MARGGGSCDSEVFQKILAAIDMAHAQDVVPAGIWRRHVDRNDRRQKVEDSDYVSEYSTDFDSEHDHSDFEGVVSEDDTVVPRFSANETLFILDWDDTLLPTSWIEAQGLRVGGGAPILAEQSKHLEILAERASQTLRLAKAYGTVVVVTNAEQGWIELSCQKFMPSLWGALEDVKLLSARSHFEHQGVAQPSVWKLLAFRDEIEPFFGPGCGSHDATPQRNIISIGDSLHEREALIRVTDRFPNSWAKAMKLMEKPSAEEFLREHAVLCGVLGDIVNHMGNLDVSIHSP